MQKLLEELQQRIYQIQLKIGEENVDIWTSFYFHNILLLKIILNFTSELSPWFWKMINKMNEKRWWII